MRCIESGGKSLKWERGRSIPAIRLRDGVGSFMAAARSHAAALIFQQRPSCFPWIRLHDTNGLQRAAVLLILCTKQVGQIYSAAAFLHNPNSMNKSNADGGAFCSWTRVRTQAGFCTVIATLNPFRSR